MSFSPDGRSLLYAGERGGSWNLYRTDLTDDDEPSFFNATALEEKPVLEIEAETYQPHFSPDGKEVAYLQERTELKVSISRAARAGPSSPADVELLLHRWRPVVRVVAGRPVVSGRVSQPGPVVAGGGSGRFIG